MIKIGEFANLTGISIHMLRNYDKIGLLSPAYTDDATGYRYYSEEQIPVANQIVVLKNLGFGLKEIEGISPEHASPEFLQNFLQEKVKEKQEEIHKAKEQLRKIQQAAEEIGQQEMRSLSVTVKTLPERTVASIRGIITHFQDEGELWGLLGYLCKTLHIGSLEMESNRYSYAITHKLEFFQDSADQTSSPDAPIGKIDVEVQRVIEKLPSVKLEEQAKNLLKEMGKDDRTLKFMKIPECQAAVLAFKGKYSQLGEINTYMADWIKKNHYRMNGISFVTYFLSPENESNPDNFITEVCFPIDAL